MSTRMFQLKCKTVEEFVASQLQTNFQTWCSQWLSTNTVHAEVIDGESLVKLDIDKTIQFKVNSDESSLSLYCSEQMVSEMASLMLPCISLNNQFNKEILSLIKASFTDLLKLFFNLGDAKITLSDNNDFKKTPGVLYIKLSINDAFFVCHFPDFLYRKLLPLESEKNINVYSREDVARQEKIDVNLVIDNVSLTINDLQNFKVGDVISLDVALRDKLKIKSVNGELCCYAYLGKKADRKAVLVTGKN